MSKQTAVEWLENQLRQHYLLLDCEYILKKAKRMEKEQMIEFVKKAPIKTGLLQEGGTYYRIDAESHYNETYGGEDEN
jgi:hypothetical protein